MNSLRSPASTSAIWSWRSSPWTCAGCSSRWSVSSPPCWGERDLTCALELPPAWNMTATRDKLARVFDNLLRNACHYSTPGSVVRISGGEEGIPLSSGSSTPGGPSPRRSWRASLTSSSAWTAPAPPGRGALASGHSQGDPDSPRRDHHRLEPGGSASPRPPREGTKKGRREPPPVRRLGEGDDPLLSPGAHGQVRTGAGIRRRAPCAPSEISAFSPAGRTRPWCGRPTGPCWSPDRGLGPRDPDGVGPPCRPLPPLCPLWGPEDFDRDRLAAFAAALPPGFSLSPHSGRALSPC